MPGPADRTARRDPRALRPTTTAAARATDRRLDQQAQRQAGRCTLISRRHRLIRLDRLRRLALTAAIATLPEQLRRSLTWDQGHEMAEHARFSIDSGVQVYFCDPRSPWQRGSNENTNGLLRQYFPKRTSVAVSQVHLDAVAAELNDRPRKRLAFAKPIEELGPLLLR